MKTYDGAQSGCCGPVQTRLKMVKEVSRRLSEGHSMLAILYRGLADETKHPTDKEGLLKAASTQEELAARSLIVTIPDGYTLEGEEDGAKADISDKENR